MAVRRISDFNVSHRGLLSGIYGNTRNSEYFIDSDLCRYNISKALFLYLKGEGYRVVFYNPTDNIGFYSYTEEDLAVFSGFTNASHSPNTNQAQTNENLQTSGSYVRQGDHTSYVPKITTPMGKMRPRFGARNQANNTNDGSPSLNPTHGSSSSVSHGTNSTSLVCHFPQIYIHKAGRNSFFKRQSSLNVFDDVIGFSDNNPHERMAVIFENPENIHPENPAQVENKFSELSKVYGEENRQLKMIVLFGYKTNGQLATAFNHEHGGQGGVFFRSSFGTLFGLAPSDQQNDAERDANMANFEKNIFCIDLPQEDEIANWLIRKRICENVDCTLSPKPFGLLRRSIAMGNFKVFGKDGGLDFAKMDDRLIINLNKSDMNHLVSTVSADNALAQLRQMDGIGKVMDKIESLKNLIANTRRQKEETGHSAIPVYPHMVFMGNPGTGKTTVARLVAQWFREENVLSKGTFISATVGDIVGQYVGETRIKAQALCERAKGGMLFIDEAYGLREDRTGHGANYTAEAVEVLIQYMTKPDFMLVLAGYKHEMEDLLMNSNPGLRSRINDDQLIMFDDYEPSELVKILNRKLTHPKTDEFCNAIRMLVEVMFAQRNLRTWGNAREMEQLAAQIYKEFYKNDNGVLELSHIPEKFSKMIDTKEKTEEEVLQNLHELIGLGNVKETLKEIYYKMRSDRLMMNAGLPVEEEDLVFVFTGSPGTGKTTVARMLGGILHDLGLLTSGDCVEKKKGDIVDNFVGGTEKNVEKLFADNVGKTLFIDEAYALCENNNKSVVNQIVGLLTDQRYKRKMALVLAGYPNDMSQFLSMNDGMMRRVNHIIHFDNYTDEELWQILQFNMQRLKRHFIDEEQCHQLALAWFSLIPRTNKFGNAGESEKLLRLLEKNNGHRLRAANNESIDLMIEYRPEDFPKAAHEVLKLHNDSEGQSLEDTVEASDNDVVQPMVSLDLTKEDETHRATCVEHLEYSVGLLTCEGGTNSEKAQGTAFIISLHNHYLLTCSHVVEGKTKFTFSISELQYETPARLLWNNSQCDMALLQVGMFPQKARYLQLCNDEKTAGKTTKITLAGYPLGEAVSRNLMINSGEITNYEANKQNNDRCFDTYMSDINATHGNSGGPIVRQDDYQVIGLLQGGFEEVQVRLITDIRQIYENIGLDNNKK